MPSGADGQWHTLAVDVSGSTYSVTLDGALLVADVPLEGSADGHVGLLASTSHVVFDDFALESARWAPLT